MATRHEHYQLAEKYLDNALAISEAENVSYRIEAFLEGMGPHEEWAVLPTPNDRDASITVHAAEQAVGKKHTSWDRTERTILATRVRRLSW